jgi:hypothetical protein
MAGISPVGVDHHGELELKLELEVDDITYTGSVFISREGWEGITQYFDDRLKESRLGEK